MSFGIIDVGGSLKAAYAAGAIEYCMDHGINFDICIGVSVGCANLSSYVAGQRNRNYAFYREYSARSEYMSYENFAKKRVFFDLDYIYGTLINTGGQSPLDYSALTASKKIFKLAATDAESGEVEFFDKSALEKDNYAVIKAACALPYLCAPQTVHGKTYIDGTLSDPIPIVYATETLGCDRVVVLLSDPLSVIPDKSKDVKLADKIRGKFPKAASVLDGRAETYAKSLNTALDLERRGKALVLAPGRLYGIDTMVRTDDGIDKLFADGYADGRKISEFSALRT